MLSGYVCTLYYFVFVNTVVVYGWVFSRIAYLLYESGRRPLPACFRIPVHDIERRVIGAGIRTYRITDFWCGVDKKNQVDVTFCILYFSSNSCSTCFGQPCAHHQELTTA